MAKYTTAIRSIVEQLTMNSDLPISKRIELACPHIFDFEYPIWADGYKPILEKKIIMHYFNKEIGFETVGLWKLYLEERLNLIMPYYNKLYETTVKDYDYLSNVNITEEYNATTNENENGKLNSEITQTENGKVNGTENITANSNTQANETTNQTTHNLSSDLPQANYNELDYGTKMDDETQNVTKNSDTNTTGESDTERSEIRENKVTSNQTSSNDLTRSKAENNNTIHRGSNGAFSITDLIVQYRKSLLNIDNMVINELNDLFMCIY